MNEIINAIENNMESYNRIGSSATYSQIVSIKQALEKNNLIFIKSTYDGYSLYMVKYNNNIYSVNYLNDELYSIENFCEKTLYNDESYKEFKELHFN
jgi:allophanate hydrolase subunit 1